MEFAIYIFWAKRSHTTIRYKYGAGRSCSMVAIAFPPIALHPFDYIF